MIKTKLDVFLKKNLVLLMIVLLIACFLCIACGKQDGISGGTVVKRAEELLASVYKGIHIKTTKNGLPTY